MKTFKQFIEENYLILERSKPKFRGTRTPEEIENLRQQRFAQKPKHQEPSRTSQKIIDKYQEQAMRHFQQSMTPEGKIDMNSPHHEKSRKYTTLAMGRQLPDYQVLDTNLHRGATKTMLRKLAQAKRQNEERKGLNPDAVIPSAHPDTHSSMASEFDRIVHGRRRKRNKKERKQEVSDMVDRSDREFRRNEILKTIGKISGQISNR